MKAYFSEPEEEGQEEAVRGREIMQYYGSESRRQLATPKKEQRKDTSGTLACHAGMWKAK
jgi:hypothetical protein